MHYSTGLLAIGMAAMPALASPISAVARSQYGSEIVSHAMEMPNRIETHVAPDDMDDMDTESSPIEIQLKARGEKPIDKKKLDREAAKMFERIAKEMREPVGELKGPKLPTDLELLAAKLEKEKKLKEKKPEEEKPKEEKPKEKKPKEKKPIDPKDLAKEKKKLLDRVAKDMREPVGELTGDNQPTDPEILAAKAKKLKEKKPKEAKPKEQKPIDPKQLDKETKKTVDSIADQLREPVKPTDSKLPVTKEKKVSPRSEMPAVPMFKFLKQKINLLNDLLNHALTGKVPTDVEVVTVKGQLKPKKPEEEQHDEKEHDEQEHDDEEHDDEEQDDEEHAHPIDLDLDPRGMTPSINDRLTRLQFSELEAAKKLREEEAEEKRLKKVEEMERKAFEEMIHVEGPIVRRGLEAEKPKGEKSAEQLAKEWAMERKAFKEMVHVDGPIVHAPRRKGTLELKDARTGPVLARRGKNYKPAMTHMREKNQKLIDTAREARKEADAIKAEAIRRIDAVTIPGVQPRDLPYRANIDWQGIRDRYKKLLEENAPDHPDLAKLNSKLAKVEPRDLPHGADFDWQAIGDRYKKMLEEVAPNHPKLSMLNPKATKAIEAPKVSPRGLYSDEYTVQDEYESYPDDDDEDHDEEEEHGDDRVEDSNEWIETEDLTPDPTHEWETEIGEETEIDGGPEIDEEHIPTPPWSDYDDEDVPIAHDDDANDHDEEIPTPPWADSNTDEREHDSDASTDDEDVPTPPWADTSAEEDGDISTPPWADANDEEDIPTPPWANDEEEDRPVAPWEKHDDEHVGMDRTPRTQEDYDRLLRPFKEQIMNADGVREGDVTWEDITKPEGTTIINVDNGKVSAE